MYFSATPALLFHDDSFGKKIEHYEIQHHIQDNIDFVGELVELFMCLECTATYLPGVCTSITSMTLI